MKETKTMEELHRIREQHYEETKDLSAEEYVTCLDQRAREIMRKYDLYLEMVEPKGVKTSRP